MYWNDADYIRDLNEEMINSNMRCIETAVCFRSSFTGGSD